MAKRLAGSCASRIECCAWRARPRKQPRIRLRAVTWTTQEGERGRGSGATASVATDGPAVVTAIALGRKRFERVKGEAPGAESRRYRDSRPPSRWGPRRRPERSPWPDRSKPEPYRRGGRHSLRP